MKTLSLLLIYVFVCCNALFSQSGDIYKQPLYDLNLLKVEALIKNNPQNLKPVELDLLSMHLNWWKLNSGYNADEFRDEALDQIDQYIKSLEDADVENQQNAIRILEALLIKSRIDLMDDNYVSTVIGMYKSLNLIEDLKEENKDKDQFKLMLCIYEYYYAYAYENYFLLRPFLMAYPKGSKEKGLEGLLQLLNSPDLSTRTEATYFLAKIYYESEKLPETSLLYTSKLVKKHPDNYAFAVFHSKVLLAAARNTALREFCTNQLQNLKMNVGLSQKSTRFFNERFNSFLKE